MAKWFENKIGKKFPLNGGNTFKTADIFTEGIMKEERATQKTVSSSDIYSGSDGKEEVIIW